MASDKYSGKRRDQAFDPQAADADQDRPEAEPYGVVEVARHVKDDGRALLLYTRPEESGR